MSCGLVPGVQNGVFSCCMCGSRRFTEKEMWKKYMPLVLGRLWSFEMRYNTLAWAFCLWFGSKTDCAVLEWFADIYWRYKYRSSLPLLFFLYQRLFSGDFLKKRQFEQYMFCWR
jgi:hypothetical protein